MNRCWWATIDLDPNTTPDDFPPCFGPLRQDENGSVLCEAHYQFEWADPEDEMEMGFH